MVNKVFSTVVYTGLTKCAESKIISNNCKGAILFFEKLNAKCEIQKYVE